MTVHRYDIRDFDDVVESGTEVRDGITVEVSITDAAPDVAQRALDFFAGVAVTGSARMTRIARGVFLIEPAERAAPREAAQPLISLPRRRPLSNVGTPVTATLGARKKDSPFWPESRRG